MAIGGLGRALEAMGHEVIVHAPRRRTGRASSRLLFNVGLRRFRGGDYDLVVGFDLDGCWLPELKGPVRVASLKGVMADEMRFERGLTRLRFRLLSSLEGRNARAADVVLVTSRYSRDVAVRAYGLDPERVEVVPEGIDLERWPDPGARHHAGGGRADDPRGRTAGGRGPEILSVAHQYPRKDTETLLRAMPEVVRAFPDTELRIVGTGPELSAHRSLARRLGLVGVVRFLGRMADREAVRREYLGADIFALPSLQEGFGIAFLEAMASRVPVVAARAGAAPEVVPHGEAGLLVPPRDPGAMAAALTRLLRDPDLRERMGAGGRRRAESFDWSRVATRFLEATGAGREAPGHPL